MSVSPTMPVSAAWWQLTPRRLLAALAPLLILALAARADTDPDLWWHLRTGQWILDNGAVPHTDPFSFTMTGTHWVAHEWLADIGMYLLYRAGGFAPLTLATTLIVAFTFVIVYHLSHLRPHVAIFTTILAALTSAVTWGPRPAMLTMLFAALTLWILTAAREHPLRLWLLPLLMLLWANIHSGFFLGLAIVGATFAGEVIEHVLARHKITQDGPSAPAPNYVRTLFITLIASVAAACINPNGLELLIYPYFTLTSKAMQTYIVEWHSPDFHDPRFLPFALTIVLLLFVMALSGKRPSATQLLLLGGLGYESLVSLRNIPLFAIVAAPVMTYQIEAMLRARTPTTPLLPASTIRPKTTLLVLNWVLLSVIALATSARVVSVAVAPVAVDKEFPVAAADFILATHPAGPMLNSYNFGGYLIWRLYPTYPVFIDGRADVYGDAFMDEYYARIWQGKGDWQGYLDHYGIKLVVIENDGVLAALLRTQPQWKLIHQDNLAAVFQRTQ